MRAQSDDPPDLSLVEHFLRQLESSLRMPARSAGGGVTSDALDDLRLEAALALWSIRERLASLPEAERPAYATACVRHALAHFLQVEARHREHEILLDEVPPGHPLSFSCNEPRPDGDLLFARLPLTEQVSRAELASALHELSAATLTVFDLFYRDERSDTEIARLLGSSAHAVKQRRMRALASLRKTLAAVGGESGSAAE